MEPKQKNYTTYGVCYSCNNQHMKIRILIDYLKRGRYSGIVDFKYHKLTEKHSP